jgi:hypothetical protein
MDTFVVERTRPAKKRATKRVRCLHTVVRPRARRGSKDGLSAGEVGTAPDEGLAVMTGRNEALDGIRSLNHVAT